MRISVTVHNPQGTFNRIFNKDVRTYIHTRVHALCSPYVPMDTGMLDQNVEINDKYVKYKSKYAQKMYHGNGFNFSKEKHPLAAAEWDVPAMQAKGGQLARETEQYINR